MAGEDHPLSKVTETEVKEIRKMRSEKVPYKTIMKKFGLSKTQVKRIVKRQSWRVVK